MPMIFIGFSPLKYQIDTDVFIYNPFEP